MGQVYRHVSPSGKSYIGRTKHTWQTRAGSFPEKRYAYKFSNAIKKYGWNNFTHEVLEESEDLEFLQLREDYWIRFYDAVENGYNIVGEGSYSERASYTEFVFQAEELFETWWKRYTEDLVPLWKIAEELGFPSANPLFQVMKQRGVSSLPRGTVGIYSRNPPKPCEICKETFSPRRKEIRTCSKPCKLRLMSLTRSGSTSEKISRSKLGNSYAKGNTGGYVRAHKYSHLPKGLFNPECPFCVKEK